MERIIRAAVERGATDLHIKAGDVFRARIKGELVPLTKQALTPKQTRDIAITLIPNEEDRAKVDAILDYDCSWGAAGVGRFRVNILRQRSSFMIVMRVIPHEVPTLENLGLPESVARIAEAKVGLVLVTGPNGSGKSSTIAAMLHHANTHTRRHILTLENPIEFLHRDINCSITQRELGVDTVSLQAALHAALRQDTDVVVMEDLHDAETLEFALQSVERARLVISSLRSADARSSLDDLLELAAPGGRGLVRARVAAALRAVIAVRLIPRSDGEGRALASEILVADSEVRSMIVERETSARLAEYMNTEDGTRSNRTFAAHLSQLVSDGIVDAEVASIVSAGTPLATF